MLENWGRLYRFHNMRIHNFSSKGPTAFANEFSTASEVKGTSMPDWIST